MTEASSNRDCDRALKQLAAGDMSALSVVYDCTARLVFSVALSLLGSTADAEDVLQDTMLEVAKSAAGYSEGNPKAWVLSIARRRAYRVLSKREQTDSTEEPSSLDPDIVRLEWFDTLNILAEDERQTVVLHIYGGFTHKEIGALLGLTPAAAQKKYRRAIEKLRKLYKG